MAELQVPNLNLAGNKKVSEVRGPVTNAGFTVAVVTEATGSPTDINNAIVLKQSPTPQAKLTAGEAMHLYIAGAGPNGGTQPIGGAGKNTVIAVQLVVIVVLVFYCFILGR